MKSLLTILTLLLTFRTHAQTSSAEILIQANRATLQRDYATALTLYNKYIVLNPSDFRGYFNRGTTEFNAEKYADAKKDFTKTLELNPKYKEAYFYRGKTEVQLKEYNLAIKDYTHVLSTNPNNIPFLKLRSEAYQANGQSKLALADLDKALSLTKLSGDLYKRRAELKVEMNDIEGALKDYSSVEKLMPRYKMVHYIKGNLFLQLEEVDFACDEFQEALDNKILVAQRAFDKHCQ